MRHNFSSVYVTLLRLGSSGEQQLRTEANSLYAKCQISGFRFPRVRRQLSAFSFRPFASALCSAVFIGSQCQLFSISAVSVSALYLSCSRSARPLPTRLYRPCRSSHSLHSALLLSFPAFIFQRFSFQLSVFRFQLSAFLECLFLHFSFSAFRCQRF